MTRSQFDFPRLMAFILPVMMCSLIFFLAGCKKETSGPGKPLAASLSGNEADSQVEDPHPQTEANTDKIADLEEADDQLRQDLEQEKADREQGDQNLQTQIDQLNEKLVALDAKVDAAILDLQAKIDLKADKTDLEDLKTWVTENFATKEELEAVSVMVETLKDVVATLQSDFDDYREETDGKLSDLLTQLESLQIDVAANTDDIENNYNELLDLINGNRADIDANTTQIEALQMAVNDLYDQLATLQGQVNRQMRLIRRLMMHKRKVDRSLANLSTQMHVLRVQVGILAFVGARAINAIRDRLAALEAADAAQQAEIDAVRSELKDAIAEETRQRELLQGEVDDLRSDLEDYYERLVEVEGVAQANATEIADLKTKLEDAKAEFAAELAKLDEKTKNRIKKVRQFARKLVRRLGKDIQEQFADVNSRIADLEQRQELAIELLVKLFVEVIRDDVELQDLLTILIPLNKSLMESATGLTTSLINLEKHFVLAIDPVLKKAGVNIDSLDQGFKTATEEVCDPYYGPDAVFSSVANREWFYHLARLYSQELLYGMRSGDASQDGIFFGHDVVVTNGSLATKLAIGIVPAYAAGTSSDCLAAVENYLKEQLFSDGDDPAALRAAIAGSSDLNQAVNLMLQRYTEVHSDSRSFMSALKSFLKKYLGTDTKVRKLLLSSINGNPSILDRMAAYLVGQLQSVIELAEIKNNRERFIQIARQVAENTETLADHQTELDNLNAAVEELSNSVADLKAEIDTLRESQIQAFNLIAAIAGRLGFDDLVDLARKEAENLGGEIDESLFRNETCLAAQHFYNHATTYNKPVTRCASNISLAGNVLSDLETTKCAVLGGFNWQNEIKAFTWGNRTEALYPFFVNDRYDGHRTGLGLLIRAYEPTDSMAIALANREKGSPYPNDGESTFMLRVLGKADSFQIDVTSEQDANHYPYSVTVNASDYKVGERENGAVFEIPVPKAIGKLGACSWNREIKISALDAQGQPRGEQCVHRFHTFSPLVLDFTKADIIQTINPLLSGARFDLDANGIKEQTGWIPKSSALLAADLNGNGKIDDGSELFGEATQLSTGIPAANGFVALAEWDSNGDGYLDARDTRFNQLKLWFDIDQDGDSATHELLSLDQVGVTKIGVEYQTLSEADAIQNHGLPEANLIKYKATFYGPKQCGPEGCHVYDVYFGATESLVVNGK